MLFYIFKVKALKNKKKELEEKRNEVNNKLEVFSKRLESLDEILLNVNLFLYQSLSLNIRIRKKT